MTLPLPWDFRSETPDGDKIQDSLDQIALQFPIRPTHARVKRAAFLAIPNAAYTAVTFDTTVSDTAGMWNSATRLTAKESGVYMAEASLMYVVGAGGVHRLCHLAVNGAGGGAAFAYGGLGGVAIGAGGAPRTNAVGVLRLSAGDYVEVLAYQDSGGALNIGGAGSEAYFSLTRLG